jgi:hypothetical protein
MANVNLKVMMRVGDNRTAMEMTEWIGKIATTKKSIGAGVTTGVSSHLLRGALDLEARRQGGESQSISIQEAEEDLVSSEELKHEMSAEKGLAWFDLGDGRIIKGRSFWFNADIPDTWEGREFITYFEKYENDEIGLADWVDEQIYSMEERETDRSGQKGPKTEGAYPSDAGGAKLGPEKGQTAERKELPKPPGPFKLSFMTGQRRGRGTVSSYPLSKGDEVLEEQQEGEKPQGEGRPGDSAKPKKIDKGPRKKLKF